MIQKFKPHYYNCTDMILNDPRLSKRIVIRYPCGFLINFTKQSLRYYHKNTEFKNHKKRQNACLIRRFRDKL